MCGKILLENRYGHYASDQKGNSYYISLFSIKTERRDLPSSSLSWGFYFSSLYYTSVSITCLQLTLCDLVLCIEFLFNLITIHSFCSCIFQEGISCPDMPSISNRCRIFFLHISLLIILFWQFCFHIVMFELLKPVYSFLKVLTNEIPIPSLETSYCLATV